MQSLPGTIVKKQVSSKATIKIAVRSMNGQENSKLARVAYQGTNSTPTMQWVKKHQKNRQLTCMKGILVLPGEERACNRTRRLSRPRKSAGCAWINPATIIMRL